MIKFVGLRAKTYYYLIEDGSENKKKTKDTKTCVIKTNLNLKIIKTVQKETNLRIKKKHLGKKVDVDSFFRYKKNIKHL